jgi:hypothetical protein
MYVPFRVNDEFGRWLVELAAVETGTNVSMLVRKLLVEARAAREAPQLVSQVVVPAEMVREAVRSPRRAGREAVASVRAEGLEPSPRGLEVLGRVAAGEVAVEAAVEELVDHHSNRFYRTAEPGLVASDDTLTTDQLHDLEVAQHEVSERRRGKPLSKVDAQRAMRERNRR